MINVARMLILLKGDLQLWPILLGSEVEKNGCRVLVVVIYNLGAFIRLATGPLHRFDLWQRQKTFFQINKNSYENAKRTGKLTAE